MYTTIVGVISFNHAGIRPNQVHSVSQVLLTKEVPCDIKVPKDGAYLVLGNHINIEFSDSALKDIKSLYPKLLEQISNKMYIPQEVEGYRHLLLKLNLWLDAEKLHEEVNNIRLKREILVNFLNIAYDKKTNILLTYRYSNNLLQEVLATVVEESTHGRIIIDTVLKLRLNVDLIDIIKAKYV